VYKKINYNVIDFLPTSIKSVIS